MTGDVFLVISLIAITVCSLAVHAGGIRMIFTMGRDNRLPYASAIAKVHGKSKTPLVPSIVIGVITILLLVLNVGNQRAFFVLTSVAIIMFYIAYLCVTGPLLIARLRGKWPTPEHGPYFNLGRWGLVVNVLAVIFQIFVMVNLAWPRPAVYGADHWYFQWGAFTFTGVLGLIGVVYYLGQAARPPGGGAGRAPGRAGGHRGRRRRRARRSLTSVQDVAGFLGSHPPFDAVDAGELARIAAVAETEVSSRGKAIFAQGAGPVEHVWMVRSGSVEVIHDGRVLDLLGPGELFGHASMISGLPTGFEARAAEDTVCYRIPADVIRPLLARPDVLRFVARSIVAREVPVAPAAQVQVRVATLIRTPPLLCRPDEPIREAARRMTDQGASAVLVPLADSFGIVTDRDLRRRVIAAWPQPGRAGLGDHDRARLHRDRRPARRRRPARHARAQRAPHSGAVAAGQVLGVVDDGDLVAAEARKPLLLRRAIALADSPAELAAAVAGLNPAIIALHDARVTAEHLTAVRSVVLDALTRRLAELAVRDACPPPVPFTWFALGSLARREAVPSSDVDSALAWEDAGNGHSAEAAG